MELLLAADLGGEGFIFKKNNSAFKKRQIVFSYP